MSHLDTNLAAHRARWGFAPAIGRADAKVRVERVAGPWPRLTLEAPDGRWLRVHSDRDPLKEAATWVARAQTAPSPAALVAIIGAGCGYALDAIETECPPETRILLLEPEPALLRCCLERRDWTSLIEAGRLLMLAGPSYEGRANAWQVVDPTAADPLVLVHPVIGQARPEEAKTAAQIIGQAIGGARANENARQQFAGRYLLNTLRNLPVIARGGDVRSLVGRYVGTPAVIAAAGPSLNRNLDALAAIEGWRDRAVVIAVDTALKPMLAAGLHPHFVVGVDPAELNARTLTDLPPLPDTSLVAEASLDPRCFDAFEDRTFLFKVSDTHHPWPWLNRSGVDVARLRAWGSVLTTAYDFALELGCDPIVFIGADLAYTNGQPYCRNTVFEEDWGRAVALGHPIEEVWSWLLPHARLVTVDDLSGKATQSSTTLVAFRDWLVAETTEQSTRRFVNATDGGILIGPRLERNALAAVIEKAKASVVSTHASVPTGNVQGEASTVAAVKALLKAAIAPLPQPLPEWLEFANERTTGVELLATLVDAFAVGSDGDPEVAGLLQARARALADEGAEWLARGWVPDPAEPPPPASAPSLGWYNGAAGDWCFGPTPSGVLPVGPIADFHSYRYLHLTARRLEHLATLGLPLRERNVLEVGAGVGDLTDFFLDRGCRVHTTDFKPQFLSILRQRFAMHPLATVDCLNLDPPPDTPPGLFDLVLCYGVLTLVSDPKAVLEFLARACTDLLLVDTPVGPGDEEAMNPTTVDVTLAGAGATAQAYRPSRAWIHARLSELFPHVYVPVTQPNHYDYPVNWSLSTPLGRRAIFVASRRLLDSPQLVAGVPERQIRH